MCKMKGDFCLFVTRGAEGESGLEHDGICQRRHKICMSAASNLL